MAFAEDPFEANPAYAYARWRNREENVFPYCKTFSNADRLGAEFDDDAQSSRPLLFAISSTSLVNSRSFVAVAFCVVDDVAQSKLQRSTIDSQGHARFQGGMFEAKILCDLLPRVLRFHKVVSDGLICYPQKHLLRETVITLRRKRNLNLIPDKPKTLRVVEDGTFQNKAVGNANDAATVQVPAYPASGFHHRSPQERDVDHVAFCFTNLDSVSHSIQVRKNDTKPGPKACDHILEGYDHPSARHS